MEAGKSYMFHVINNAAEAHMTVCFDKHEITIVQADGTPMEPLMMSDGCVDINTGERWVALT